MAKTQTPAPPKPTSMKTEDAVEGGGLWQGGPATITNIEYCRYSYPGKDGKATTKPVPVLLVEYTHAEGKEEQPLSLGSGQWDFYDADGALVDVGGVMAVNRNGALTKSCNAFEFIKSVEEASESVGKGVEPVDMDVFTENVKEALEGRGVLAVRKAQPERAGVEKRKSADGRVFERTFVLVGELGSTKGKRATTDDDDDDDDAPVKAKTTNGSGKKKANPLAEEAADAIREVLEGAKGNTLKLDQLAQKVHAHLKGHPERDDIAELVENDDWVAGLDFLSVNTKKNVVELTEE